MENMTKGRCILSLVPMRREPRDQSEMVNQVLFGESFDILQEQEKWSEIKLHHDDYSGWVDRKQIHVLGEHEDLKADHPKKIAITSDLIELITDETHQEYFPILLGSYLPDIDDEGNVTIGSTKFKFKGNYNHGVRKRLDMVGQSYQFLNAPYLWGGRSPFGIDCSGFTQLVYRLAGINIPRDAWQQAEVGSALSFIEESEPGDLAFFDNAEGKITHVGIILKENYIIHASGKVRLDRLDQMGIFNEELGNHTHKLRVIKRLL
jgi:hypothetical protein